MGICKSTCSIRCKYFYSSQRLCRIDIIKTSCRGFQWDRYLNTFLNSELKTSVTTGKSMLILPMTHTIMKIECPIKWGNEKIVSKSWPTLVGQKLSLPIQVYLVIHGLSYEKHFASLIPTMDFFMYMDVTQSENAWALLTQEGPCTEEGHRFFTNK